MNALHKEINHDEKGQALVVVLLMIVVAVIVAVAISFRTIQDIRRAGEERMSAKTGTQVESMLDVVMSPGIFDEVIENCDAWSDYNTCYLNENDLQTLGVDMTLCEEGQVALRPETDISGVLVSKDDAFELRLDTVLNAGSINVSWENADDAIPVSELIVKVYKAESSCVANAEGYMDCTDSAYAFTRSGSWGNIVVDGGHGVVSFSADAALVRIKPLGGNVRITITNLPNGLPPHVATAKAYCYTKGSDGEDVYREFVRRLNINASLPACFDYVLFAGDDDVNKNL